MLRTLGTWWVKDARKTALKELELVFELLITEFGEADHATLRVSSRGINLPAGLVRITDILAILIYNDLQVLYRSNIRQRGAVIQLLTGSTILESVRSTVHFVLFVVEPLVVLRSCLLVALVLVLSPSLLFLRGLVAQHRVAVGVLLHLQQFTGMVQVVKAIEGGYRCLGLRALRRTGARCV